MKPTFYAFVAMLLFSFVFAACNRDAEDALETQSSQDNSKVQSEFDDINELIQDAMEDNVSGNEKIASDTCVQITLNTTDKILTIDFGDGCTDAWGVERKGKIIAQYTGAYKTAGTVITVSLEDYEVNGNQISGTKTITNQGEVNGAMTWEIVVSNAKLIDADGDEITWESTRYRALADEGATAFAFDDTYHVWGTASGVNRNGRSFTMTVDESSPLVIDLVCWYTTRLPTAGIVTISPDALKDRSIDYGDADDCDRKVTVSVGDRSVELSL